MFKIIDSHNKYILNKFNGVNCMDPPCNCRNSNLCPVKGKCRASNVIYQASNYPKENSLNHHIYTGISAGEWKQRLYNYGHSSSNPRLKHQTAFSKRFRGLREKDLKLQIGWKFIDFDQTPSNFKGRCNLCLG